MIKTLSATAIATLLVTVALTGCATDSASNDGSATLLDTKLAAQLLRNSISGQLSPESTAEVTQVEDASEACEADDGGLMRMWRSTALTELTAEPGAKVKAIVETMSGGLVAKGWTSTADQKNVSKFTVELENPNSTGLIRITSTEDIEGDTTGATIFVEVTGPCVKTDGPGSDELKKLGE